MEMRNLGGRQIPNSHNPRRKVPRAPISLIPFFDAFVGHVNIPIWNTNMNSQSGIDAPLSTILCMLVQSVADGRWRTVSVVQRASPLFLIIFLCWITCSVLLAMRGSGWSYFGGLAIGS